MKSWVAGVGSDRSSLPTPQPLTLPTPLPSSHPHPSPSIIFISSITTLARRARFTDALRLQLLVTNSCARPILLAWDLTALMRLAKGTKAIELVSDHDLTLLCENSVVQLYASPAIAGLTGAIHSDKPSG